MKIKCHCGELIPDTTDYLPYKGYIIPDQDWFNVLDAIDDAVEKSGPEPKEKEKALMAVRSLMIKVSKTAWQCHSCGLLYINKAGGQLDCFQPKNGDTSKEVLKRDPANA